MRSITFAFAVLFLSMPAMAQHITMNAVCGKEMGALYEPGVDVEGQAVTPADLPKDGEETKGLVFPILIPIEINTLRLLDLEVPAQIEGAVDGKADVAYIALFEDGHMEYNGVDISSVAKFNCMEPSAGEEESPKTFSEFEKEFKENNTTQPSGPNLEEQRKSNDESGKAE